MKATIETLQELSIENNGIVKTDKRVVFPRNENWSDNACEMFERMKGNVRVQPFIGEWKVKAGNTSDCWVSIPQIMVIIVD